MTVCFLSKRFHPKIGGAEIQAQLLAGWLARQGINVIVITLQLQPSWPREERLDGFLIRRVPLRNWILELACELLRHRRNINVIHSQGTIGSFNEAGAFIARCLRIPVIGQIATEGDVSQLSTRKLGALRVRLLRRLDAFLCMSEPIVRELELAGIETRKLHQIPNVVDAKVFHPPPSRRDRPFTVVFVGRLVARKGVDVLLRAWKSVAAKHPYAHLHIVGNGGGEPDSVEEQLKQITTEKKLNGSVSFLGAKHDIVSLLQSANLFAFPSRREGQPGVILEAMAVGMPIVATRIGGVTDTVTDGVDARLVPPDDDTAMSEAILSFMENPTLAARLGAAARTTVETKYSLDVVGPKYLELYEHLAR